MTESAHDLKERADRIRRDVIGTASNNGAGHIAPSLSCVDILVALYYGAMTHDPIDPQWEGRDRLIFSKSHGCYGLYAVLTDKGWIPSEEWHSFHQPGNSLSGCSERRPEYGIEAGCGSLGHGLSMAAGVAFGARLQKKSYHTFCVVGDGEMQEGSVWEAVQFAVKHELANLTLIVDRNRLQAMDFITRIMDREDSDLMRRLEGFGLSPVTCNGHDAMAMASLFTRFKSRGGDRPSVLVAETVKGYGLKCMENIPKFHYRLPTAEELKDSHEPRLSQVGSR